MQFRIVLLLAALCLSLSVVAQQPVSQNAKPTATPSPYDQLVEKQFGADFTVDAHFNALRGDLDGDGTEDIAIIAKTKHPMGGMGGFNYKVSDPYDTYFGVGDPKITTTMGNFGDGSGHCILIIHDWKAATPKAKWVIVNVPFKDVALGQVTVKKKTVAAVTAIEQGGMNSFVFFDGHKYRWEPSSYEEEQSQN